jgi:hypothetical protein
MITSKDSLNNSKFVMMKKWIMKIFMKIKAKCNFKIISVMFINNKILALTNSFIINKTIV